MNSSMTMRIFVPICQEEEISIRDVEASRGLAYVRQSIQLIFMSNLDRAANYYLGR